jgi:hypothetical protein
MAFLGVMLMMSGFGAVYTRLCSQAGWTGLVGFVFVELAYLLQACKVTWELFLYPVIAQNEAAVVLFRAQILRQSVPVVAFRAGASLTILVGIVLFCLALVRSRAFPRSGGLLVFVGALIYAAGPRINVLFGVSGIFVFALGCLVLGLRLMRSDVTTTPNPK